MMTRGRLGSIGLGIQIVQKLVAHLQLAKTSSIRQFASTRQSHFRTLTIEHGRGAAGPGGQRLNGGRFGSLLLKEAFARWSKT